MLMLPGTEKSVAVKHEESEDSTLIHKSRDEANNRSSLLGGASEEALVEGHGFRNSGCTASVVILTGSLHGRNKRTKTRNTS